MGQINCHCQTTQNQILQSQSLRKQPTMGVPVGKRRVKSRVNSIISPRQIEAFTNSSETMNINTNNSNHKKAQSSLDLRKWSEKMTNNFDKNREKTLKNLKQRYKSNLNCAQLLFYYEGISHKIQLSSEQKTLGLVFNQRDQEGFNFPKFQNSNYYNLVMNTEIDHQQFSICAKYSDYQNCLRLLIKDNRLGLGVFKYIKQNQQIFMDISDPTQTSQDLFHNKTQPKQMQNNENNEQILLDIAVGQFLIIKLFSEESKSEHLKSKGNYFIKCLLITQNKSINEKASKSLPSLFFVNPKAPTSTPIRIQSPNNSQTKQSMWIIRQGEQKSILNRVLIKVPNKKQRPNGITIESVHPQGFYKLLSKYEQINHQAKLRCGSKLYEIEIDESDYGLKCKMAKIQR